MKQNRQSAGFTLIELLLIVAIFVIIVSGAISVTTNRIFVEDIDAKSLEVVELIERARNYSVAGYQGDVWGIKILDSSSDCQDNGDCIVLFKGRPYNDRDSAYDRFVNFDANTGVYFDADQENEFYFSYQSGWLASTTGALPEQMIDLQSNAGVNRSIVISPSGITSIFTCGEDKVYDIEGNGYRTIEMGGKCWMAENLNVGVMLAAYNSTPSNNGYAEKWCYDNDVDNCSNEGALYDWDELMNYSSTHGGQGLCPNGWHIPTTSEFSILESLFDSSVDGYNLRLGGPSGFDLPSSGEMNPGAGYDSKGSLATLWSSYESTPTTISRVYYIYDSENPNVLNFTANNQNWGFGARCIKDN